MLDFMLFWYWFHIPLAIDSFSSIISNPINLVSSLPLSVGFESIKSSKLRPVAIMTVSKSFSEPIVSTIFLVVSILCSSSNITSSPSGSTS